MNCRATSILLLLLTGAIQAEYKKLKINKNEWNSLDLKPTTSDSRIIGGSEANIEKYPWMVSLSDKNKKHFCGGTLIASDIVLSAAHCLKEKPICSSETIVRVGYNNLSENAKDKGQDYKIIRRIIHTDFTYSKQIVFCDLLLLKLDRKTNIQVFPSFATEKIDNLDNIKLITMGWGITKEGDMESISNTLQMVELPLISVDKCEPKIKKLYPDYDSSIMLCAGGDENESKDACKGDSGGPLIGYDENNAPVIYGITSFGKKCGQKGVPGMFTRVSAFTEFIHWNMF